MLRLIKKFFKKNANIDKASFEDQHSLAGISMADDISAKDTLRLAKVSMAQENYEDAQKYYSIYTSIEPQKLSGYIGWAYALLELDRCAEAIPVLEKAIAIDGNNVDVFFMLGRAYLSQHRMNDADIAWARANELDPTFEHLYREYCLLLFRLGKIDRALSLMNMAIVHFPENSQFHFFLGNLLSTQGDFSNAVHRYQKAIDLGDSSSGLLSGLGAALIQVGRQDEAIDVLSRAQQMTPECPLTASNYLLAIQYSSQLTRAEKFAAATTFAERFEAPLRNQWGNYLQSFDEVKNRRLRIGYVSGDLRNHSLAFFFEPILNRHDKSSFEIFCYYSSPIFDNVTQRIKAMADHWRPCYDMSDEILASQIREDRIDILIDLSGHTGYNRLLTFARKPAPVQMTWLGYQATTGLLAMDYRITEETLDPSGTSEIFHSERLVRLASSGTFSPSPDSPPVNVLPALTSKYFTYGCLNNPTKITDEAVALWAQILTSNQSARLMLGSATDALIERLTQSFKQHGVYSDQLVFVPKVDLIEYLALHHQIDIALDTFPYNGGTTTFHSLWMGVPVIALEGDSALSKVGSAVMSGLGLSQFCARTPEQYVANALHFSKQLNELNSIRQTLRDTMRHVTEHLSEVVTTSLEEAMQSCWVDYCKKVRSVDS